MKIEKNKVVAVAYDLQAKDREGNVEVSEKVNAQEPMVFLFGSSGLPEKFEEELDGLSNGSEFKFVISSDEAYGDFEEEAVVNLSKEIFKIDGDFDESKFQVGTFVPMSDADGNFLRGKVLAVNQNELTIDFNHPLAGLNLEFQGKVVEVREATAEELDHGHVHGPGGHHH